METLKAGTFAYFDSFAGLVPCKVKRIYHAGGALGVDATVTATRGPYKRGEVLEFKRPKDVIPRRAVTCGKYGTRIHLYNVYSNGKFIALNEVQL